MPAKLSKSLSRVLGRDVTLEEADAIRERYLKEGEHYRRQGQGYVYDDCVIEHLWDEAPGLVSGETSVEPLDSREPHDDNTVPRQTSDKVKQEEKRKWLEEHGTVVRVRIDEGTGMSYRFKHDGKNYRIRIHPRWTRQRPMLGRKIWVTFAEDGTPEFHGIYLGRLVTDGF